MDLGLTNRVVLITGASQGLGAAIAEAFGTEGSNLVLVARNQSALEQVAAAAQHRGAAAVVPITADVTKPDDMEQVIRETIHQFGTIHVLVNNAGMLGRFTAFDDLTDTEWWEVFQLNVFALVQITRAVLPHMRQQQWGRIINMTSESSFQPDAAMPHYSASKAALLNLTKSLSKAYGPDGVLINSVAPAFIKTPMVEELLEHVAQEQQISQQEAEVSFLRENRPHIVLQRGGTPAEVAAAVVFLASEAASFIVGTNVRVDGGSVASI